MQATTRRRSAMLGVLVWGFGAAWMLGACDGSSQRFPPLDLKPPDTSTETPEQCPDTVEDPCLRYKIPLVGDPTSNVAVRDKYKAAFGSPCYMSVIPTFDCFYQEKELLSKACTDAQKIAEVYGAAPYDKGYECLPVAGTDDYWLQVGPDVANNIRITYENAPRQTPLVVVGGVPTEVSGPYRDLVDPAEVAPGYDFDRPSGQVDADGGSLEQREWVLEVNRNKHEDKKIHSDLAGFTWTCPGEDGGLTTCEEPDVLGEPSWLLDARAEVHHVVPRKDMRCCPWGTNSYKNAAVISHKLNQFLGQKDPPEEEVKKLNDAAAYMP